MYQDILDKINNTKSLDLPEFCKINTNLRNFTNWSTSAGIGFHGDQMVDHLVSVMLAEVSQTISKEVLKNLFNTSKFDYMDVTNSIGGIDNLDKIKELVNLIMIGNYQNIITSSKVGSVLQDSTYFNVFPFSKSVTSASPYSIGKIRNSTIWIDPFMRWDDTRVCLFNQPEVNVQNFGSSVVGGYSFAPRVKIDFDLSHQVGDSKVIYVIEDKNSPAFNHYKSLQRDIKIDKVLGKDQELSDKKDDSDILENFIKD
jgi:hypothetical protein